MRFAAAVVLSFVLCQPMSAQDPVAKHRALYEFIEGNLSKYRSTQATREDLGLEERSVEGGWIQAYCDGDEIRKIFAEDDGETFTGKQSLYFDHDSLFFAYRHDGHGHMSESSGPYPKRTDFDDERLYFTDGKLVRWLGNKSKSIDVTSDSARRRAEEYLAEAREYHDMMPACKPKPRTPVVDTSDADKAVTQIRAIYNVIEREKATYRHGTGKLDELLFLQPPAKGTIDAYCHDGAVRLMVVTQTTGKDTYYFDRESLVFLYRQPANGHEERLYFASGTLMRWLNDKNEPQDVKSAEARRLAGQLDTDASGIANAVRGCGVE